MRLRPVITAFPDLSGESRESVRLARADFATIQAVPTTVLVIDDHPSFRRLARRLLEAAGFIVVDEAGDGASGLRAARALRPDVILLDVMLPDTTGIELAEVLAATSQPPVVVLTSSRSAADLEPALARSSARGFIAKRDLDAASFATLVGGAA